MKFQVFQRNDAGVVGIIKYFKPPSASKGQDCYTVLNLVDETQHSPCMPCVLFNPLMDKLPIASHPGEVVMIKGLIINKFQGHLQGRGHERSLVGLFPADPARPVPDKIGDWYYLKEFEKKRIEQLTRWASKESPFLLNSKLEELTFSNYCCTLCLVVTVGQDSRGAMVLAVCDGTVPRSPMAEIGPLTVLSHNTTLHHAYRELTSTVTVSVSFRPQVEAGDVVQLVNVHMARCERPKATGSDLMELVVQDHPHYQGAVSIFPEDSAVVAKFRSMLPQPEEASSIDGSGPVPSGSGPVPQLSTVIDCENSQHSTLAEIAAAPVGSVHVAEVCIVDVVRRVCTRVEDLCQLRCTGCKSLYMTPRPQAQDSAQLLTAGDNCVCCCTDTQLEPNKLEFMYAFTLLITDSATQMEVALSGVEANRFFSQLEMRPTNLYTDSQARHTHLDLLHRMVGGSSDPFQDTPLDSTHQRPLLSLCIAVFVSSTGNRRFKITNTQLCNT